jgi:hypothetical protein
VAIEIENFDLPSKKTTRAFRNFVKICLAFPTLTIRAVPMSQKKTRKSTIGFAAFLASREHFPASNFNGISSAQFSRCKNDFFRLGRLSD